LGGVIPPWCCDLDDDNPYCSLPIFIIITTQSVSSSATANANAASAAVMNTRTKAPEHQNILNTILSLFYTLSFL
jgi:hypothetical protein